MDTCEIHTTVDDTDDGGPYDFIPCEQPVTQIIKWQTGHGLTVTLGVCAFPTRSTRSRTGGGPDD